jgi:hypothetical protein
VFVRLGAAEMPPGTNRWIGLQKAFLSKRYCSAVGDKWSKLRCGQNSDSVQKISRRRAKLKPCNEDKTSSMKGRMTPHFLYIAFGSAMSETPETDLDHSILISF